MKVNGTLRAVKTERVFRFGLTAHFMKVTGKTTRPTDVDV